jgi:hypothetical protein
MKRFLLFIFFATPFSLLGSNYYWVGNSGNWNDYANHWATTSGGAVFYSQQPTATDNVYFDSNSFSSNGNTVSASSTTMYCKNMDWSGINHTATFSGSQVVLNIFGSFTLSTNLTWTFTGQLNFKATTLGNTITSAGNSLMMVTFNGIGGTWVLQDSLNCFRPTITNGTLYSNNQNMTCSGIIVGPGANAGIHLGTSQILINGNNGWDASPSPTQVFADSATFTYSGGPSSGGQFSGGDHSYHRLIFYNNSWIMDNNTFHKVEIFSPIASINYYSSNTFDSLYLRTPGQEFLFPAGITQTIVNVFEANTSCTSPSYIHSTQNWSQAFISKSSGTVTLDYMQMVDILASGGANFTATNTAATNVSGWNVIAPANQSMYWIGGAGNWNDPSHWSHTSGGPAGSCIPTQLDNIYFDANSFTGNGDTVKLNVGYGNCTNMDWTGVTGNPVFDFSQSTGGMNIYGNLKLVPAMSLAGSSYFDFKATTIGHTITSGGQHIQSLEFHGHLGSWYLQDSLDCYQIYTYAGTLYTNNNEISICVFDVSGWAGEGIHMGTSVVNFTGSTSYQWNANSSPIVVDAASASFIFHFEPNFYAASFIGGNNAYGHVDFSELTYANIHGSNTFRRLDGPTKDFPILGTTTVDSLYLNNIGYNFIIDGWVTVNNVISGSGNCNAYLGINSYNPGTAYIHKASGIVNMDYLNLTDITADGGATFNSLNSNVVSNVSGWNFSTTNISGNRYWIGGTGNWNDPSHWSTTSGGTGGACLPSSNDSVFFDANSFTGTNQSVTITTVNVQFKNMDWTGATGSPEFIATSASLDDFGSLTLIPAMTLTGGSFTFRATSAGQTITSGGQDFSEMNFDGAGGIWTLSDSLNGGVMKLYNGKLISASHAIDCAGIEFVGSLPSIDLGTSDVIIETLDWIVSNIPGAVNCDSATFTLNGTFMQEFVGGNHTYKKVDFNGSADCTISDNNIFHEVSGPSGDLTIYGDNTFDTLSLRNPGHTFTLQYNHTQTINNSFTAIASGGNQLTMNSSMSGQTSFISMPAGDTVCLNNIIMQDQHAIGGGAFYAGINSSDMGGNNSGWTFNSCNPVISDVWPGDANYDLVVDVTDILNIGIAYNETGFARPSASTNFVAQPCMDWSTQFLNGTNVKHADCDGSGTVNSNDVTAVSLNYGQNHPARLRPDSVLVSGPDLYFQFPPSILAGTYINVDVELGTVSQPATSVYGTAFTINYPSAMIVPGTLTVSYSGSWLVAAGNNVHLEKDFYAQDKIDLGFSRMNHSNVNGYGKIATLTFQVAPLANGPMQFSFSGITIVNNTGAIIPANTLIGNSTVTGVTGQPENYSGNEISIYPNPSGGEFRIDLGNEKLDQGIPIEINSISGNEVAVIPASQERIFRMDLSGLSDGIYFIRMTLEDGTIVVRKAIMESGK